jgi:hypothetical protein
MKNRRVVQFCTAFEVRVCTKQGMLLFSCIFAIKAPSGVIFFEYYRYLRSS